MIENNNMPAFPISCSANETGIYSLLDARYGGDHTGLSKREYFAGLAMQGLLAGRWATTDRVDCSPETIATMAVNHAEQLLAELSKPQP